MVNDLSLQLPTGFQLAQVNKEAETLIIDVLPTQMRAPCPQCGYSSAHIHSRYPRLIRDLPSSGLCVHIRIKARRFYCLNLACPQQIFCERLTAIVSARGRFSLRLNQIISFIGLTNGGQMGARLAARLSINVSHDTLLRRIRSFPQTEGQVVTFVGLDDWAIRKGQRYGTIVVDLERHCPIDLLPDRSSETVANWLKAHPEIAIVSRDRGNTYIDGANKGAPQAIQVADRFHLLQNLTDAVERFLKNHTNYIKQASEAMNGVSTPAPLLTTIEQAASPRVENPVSLADSIISQPVTENSSPQVSLAIPMPVPQPTVELVPKPNLRHERYEQVRALHQQGAGIQTIAKHFGMHRRTVRLLIRAQSYPERVSRSPRPTTLTKYLPYIQKRWAEGCHNTAQLWRELKMQGFKGGQSTVRHGLDHLRPATPDHLKSLAKINPQQVLPSIRHTAWLFGQKSEKYKPEQQQWVTKLCETDPQVQLVYNLAQTFAQMVGDKKANSLAQWLADAQSSGISELANFAKGLRREQASIEAALTLPFSQGQVEGQVNRLKLLKREMYGRAKLDLLRQRVLNKV